MKIGNYLNSIKDHKQDPSERRLDRLEKRRASWDQTFDRMQQKAIKDGDSEKAQQIFEMSETTEARLDKKLDKLEERTGSFNWDRHMDNAFDKLQAKAYAGDDSAMAESVFGLSQVVKGGKFDPSKRLLLENLLSASDTGSSSSAATMIGGSSSETSWEAFLKASTDKTAATGTTASSGTATTGTTVSSGTTTTGTTGSTSSSG